MSTEVPCVVDGIWSNGWPKDDELPPDSLYQPAGPGPNMNIGNNWTRCCIARHGMAVNVGFEDGHASTVQLPDLWRLRWHSKWNLTIVNANMPQIRAKIKDLYKGT
jgi:hypothetical protein